MLFFVCYCSFFMLWRNSLFFCCCFYVFRLRLIFILTDILAKNCAITYYLCSLLIFMLQYNSVFAGAYMLFDED